EILDSATRYHTSRVLRICCGGKGYSRNSGLDQLGYSAKYHTQVFVVSIVGDVQQAEPTCVARRRDVIARREAVQSRAIGIDHDFFEREPHGVMQLPAQAVRRRKHAVGSSRRHGDQLTAEEVFDPHSYGQMLQDPLLVQARKVERIAHQQDLWARTTEGSQICR